MQISFLLFAVLRALTGNGKEESKQTSDEALHACKNVERARERRMRQESHRIVRSIGKNVFFLMRGDLVQRKDRLHRYPNVKAEDAGTRDLQ